MEEDPGLVEALLELYRAMSSGDAGRVEAMYSLDPLSVFVGTDDEEFWTDAATHDADVRPYFDGSRGLLRVAAGEPRARVEGDLGWTIDRPRMTFPDGTSITPRITFVWRRERERWRVVHSHASVGMRSAG
jgi:ketosteroid isomerase-like protein